MATTQMPIQGVYNSETGKLLGVATPGGSEIPLANSKLLELIRSYELAKSNNSRINATIPVAAESVAPTAGQIGFSVAAAGTIANYTEYTLALDATNAVPENSLANDGGFFRVLGGMPFQRGGALSVMTHWLRDGANFSRSFGKIQFSTDSPDIVFTMTGPNKLWLVIDDGTGPKAAAAIDFSTGGGYKDVKVDLSQVGGRKRRIITVVTDSGDPGSIRSVKLPLTASVYRLDKRPAQVVALTDSLGNTVRNGSSFNSFTATLADYLNCDVWSFSEGSTGYTTRGDGPTTKTTFAERIDVLKAMPKYMRPSLGIFCGGVNDPNDANITTAVTDAITKWIAAFPGVPLIVTGPWSGSGSSNIAVAVSREAYIKAAVDKFDKNIVRFLPTMTATPPYISGSGNTTTAANNGNADFIFDSGDSTHWNTYGHSQAVGPRLAGEVVEVLRQLAGLA